MTTERTTTGTAYADRVLHEVQLAATCGPDPDHAREVAGSLLAGLAKMAKALEEAAHAPGEYEKIARSAAHAIESEPEVRAALAPLCVSHPTRQALSEPNIATALHLISGGSETGDDEVCARTRELLNALGISRRRGLRIWASRSQGGGQCRGCGRDIQRGQIEYDLMVVKATSPLFQQRCFEFVGERDRQAAVARSRRRPHSVPAARCSRSAAARPPMLAGTVGVESSAPEPAKQGQSGDCWTGRDV